MKSGCSLSSASRGTKKGASVARMPALRAALARPRADDPRRELETIVRETYAVISRTRHAVTMIERSALDVPELAQLFFGRMRGGSSFCIKRCGR